MKINEARFCLCYFKYSSTFSILTFIWFYVVSEWQRVFGIGNKVVIFSSVIYENKIDIQSVWF